MNVDRLVEENLPLATALAARHRGPGVEFDDLLQAARVGLVQAAQRYDPQRGKFGSYACPWILGEIRALLRQRPMTPLPEGSEPAQECVFDEQVESKADLHRALMALPPPERSAVVLVGVKGLARKQAAEQLGISQATLSRRLARAGGALRARE